MKSTHIYWVLMIILGAIHLLSLSSILPWVLPIFLPLILSIGGTYLFYSHTEHDISVLGNKVNSLLFTAQIILVFIQFEIIPSSIYHLLPFVVAILIEFGRFELSQRIASYQYDIRTMEEHHDHFNETFRIVRSERHDFLKHVSAIHFMLEKEKNLEAKKYLDQLVDNYEETNLSIKGERGTVAGTLHQAYRKAKNKGIEIIFDLDLPLSSLPLNDQAIVTLLGNLLSNSIEACEEWQHKTNEQATLLLQFYKRSGLYLLICKNNSLPIPTVILDRLYHSYGHTTKQEGHEGLGTKLIIQIVEEHKGILDFVHKNEEFTVKIKIPVIR